MSFIDQNKINQIISKLATNSESEDILKKYNIAEIIDNSLNKIQEGTKEYIKSHRIILYKNYHPYLFKPIVNHMLAKTTNSLNANKFEQFDMNFGVEFGIKNQTDVAKMQTISKYSHHPFDIENIIKLNNKIRINLTNQAITFNQDNLELWVSPHLSEEDFIHIKTVFNSSPEVRLAFEKEGRECSIKLKILNTSSFSLPLISQLMLESVSPKMFGNFRLQIDQEIERILNQKVKLKYIDIYLEKPCGIPVEDIFCLNIMPIFSIFDEYSKNIVLDGKLEYQPIYSSNTYYKSNLLQEKQVTLDDKVIKAYKDADNKPFNYLIEDTSHHHKQFIKINGRVQDMIFKNIQIQGLWTQLLNITDYQEESIKILDRSKGTYSLNVLYKAKYVLNENCGKVNRFVELSHFLNNQELNKKILMSLYKIITPKEFEKITEENLLDVTYNAFTHQLNLELSVKNENQKERFEVELDRIGKLINYLYSNKVDVRYNINIT